MSTWVIVASVFGLSLITERAYKYRVEKKYRSTYKYIRIIPHINTRSEPDQVMRMIQNLHEYRRTKLNQIYKGKEWFRYLIFKNDAGELSLYMGFPEDRQTGVKRAIRNIYPEVELEDLDVSDVPIHFQENRKDKSKKLYGGFFEIAQKGENEGFALNSYSGKEDIEDILYSLDAGGKDSQTWLDICVSPVSNREIHKLVKRSIKAIFARNGQIEETSKLGLGYQDFKDAFFNEKKSKSSNVQKKVSFSELDPDEQERIRTMRKRYTGRETAFSVSINLMSYAKYSDSIAQTAATAVRSAFHLDNSLRFVLNKRVLNSITDRAPIPDSSRTITMTGQELSNIFRLPRGDHRIYKYVPHLQKGQQMLDDDQLNEGISIGKMLHPAAKNRAVKIPISQFTRHFILTGMTGAGKSSLLVEIIDSVIEMWLNDSRSSPGFTLCDPAQETGATILNRLRYYEKIGRPVDWDKVHYFDLANHNYVLPLNLLHRRPGEATHDLMDEIFESIQGQQSMYGGGPQMDRILRNSLITLLSDNSATHNILGIIPLLMDGRFRDRVLPHVRDPIIKQFWRDEFPAISQKLEQAVGPLLNRLSPFQTNEAMRRMFGQSEMGLDIRKWMDEGHIIIFDLKGASNQTVQLAGGYIANQYHKTAQGRGTGSRVHLLIYDEAHRTQYPVMANIFAEDRKFGLSLGLSTQYIKRMHAYIIDSATEIVNNIFSTTQGHQSATLISQMTAGAFDKDFLQNLPERTMAIYTRTKVDGRNTATPFTTECDPPYTYKPDGSGDWADHENDEEMLASFEWGLSKGRELMARDCVRAEDVDEVIDAYLESGTVLQIQKRQQTRTSTNTNTDTQVPKIRRARKLRENNTEVSQPISRWDI